MKLEWQHKNDLDYGLVVSNAQGFRYEVRNKYGADPEQWYAILYCPSGVAFNASCATSGFGMAFCQHHYDGINTHVNEVCRQMTRG